MAASGPTGELVHPPGTILTLKGTLSQVFTPFHRRWTETEWSSWPTGGSAEVLDAGAGDGIPTSAQPPPHPGGEMAAFEQLTAWLQWVDDYPTSRDLPAIDGTSRLSQDLRWGTISPRTVATVVGTATPARQAFVRQLAWRDWYAHLLWGRPEMVDRPLRPSDEHIEWRSDVKGFAAWRDGRTGYPIVDAGMRQLAGHRVDAQPGPHDRGVVPRQGSTDRLASRGERYFRHVLLDGDVAQNVGNWQWVAGTGPDAAPYFRIFNPITQSRKFDAGGNDIRSWVPELVAVPAKWIHAPWEAPPLELLTARCTIGIDYPAPIVDHPFARDRTLAAYVTARAIPTDSG